MDILAAATVVIGVIGGYYLLNQEKPQYSGPIEDLTIAAWRPSRRSRRFSLKPQ
jgi:hypothetical protein